MNLTEGKGKYWFLFKLRLREITEFPIDFAAKWAHLPVSLTVYYFVYGAAFQYNPTFASTTFPHLLTYLFLTLIFRRISTHAYVSTMISDSIQRGNFLQHITRPVDYFTYNLTRHAANPFLLGLMSIPFIIVVPFFLIENFTLNVGSISMAFILSGLGVITLFEIYYIIGLLTFWLEEIWGLKNATNMVGWLFSGAIVPIALLPLPAQWFAYVLPFQHAAAIPAQLILGQKNVYHFGESALILLGWITILYYLQKHVWKKGLLKHDGKG